MLGFKHTIECHCILPLYKNKQPTVYHKFTVYTKIDNKGKVIPKYVNCNNCGITHNVYEICKSDIKIGKEDITSVRNIKDIKFSLNKKVVSLLEEYNCEMPVYEEIEDILEQEIFPTELILKREIIDEEHHIKLLQINGKSSFKIKSEVISTILRGKIWATQ